MDWFSAPDYWLTGWLLQRALGLIYLTAFIVALRQFEPLLGENGLLPVPRLLGAVSFWQAPGLFQLGYSDGRLRIIAWTGAAISLALLVGFPQAGPLWLTMVAWIGVWVLYLSIVNVGQTFYSFGWESLLLEAGFLAIFLGNDQLAPSLLVVLLFRWLLFRVEFGAGLIKLRGDPCWRDLTCLDYHHETQPMPNSLSWYFHRLPRRLHRVEVLGNFFAQLVAPIGLFLPQPIAALSGLVVIGTQGYLVISGNYAWLNAITIVIGIAALPGALLGFVIPISPPSLIDPPIAFEVAVAALGVLVLVLSYWPVANMLGPRQLMNFSFNQFHIVNTYGAFGSVTRERYEVIIEGSAGEDPWAGPWREYEFKGKPGDPLRRPPQIAPYHLRLDWLMWFAALSPAYAEGWFGPFLRKLLEGDRAVLGLIRPTPFPDTPPTWIRAMLYRYQYTSRRERRQTGAWWKRTLIGEYYPPTRLRDTDDRRVGQR